MATQDKDTTKYLYHSLKGRGYNVGKDTAEFENLLLKNPDSRKWAYEKGRLNGLNVGKSYEEFSEKVAPKAQRPKAQRPTTEPGWAHGVRPNVAGQKTTSTEDERPTSTKPEAKRNATAQSASRPSQNTGEKKVAPVSLAPDDNSKYGYSQAQYESATPMVDDIAEQLSTEKQPLAPMDTQRVIGKKVEDMKRDLDYDSRYNEAVVEVAKENMRNITERPLKRDLSVSGVDSGLQNARKEIGDDLGVYLLDKAVTNAIADEDKRKQDDISTRFNSRFNGGMSSLFPGEIIDTQTYFDADKMAEKAVNNMSAEDKAEIISSLALTAEIDDLRKAGVPDYRLPNKPSQKYIDQATKNLNSTIRSELVMRIADRWKPKNGFEQFMSKFIGGNTVTMMATYGSMPKSQIESSLLGQQMYDQENGVGVAGYLGMAAGMASDPLLYLTGGTSTAATKLGTNLATRMVLKKTATKAAQKAFANKFVTKLGQRAVGGAVNLGLYEGGLEAIRQGAYGGYYNPETGQIEDYNPGAILSQTIHGSAMGAAVGATGLLFGNASQKAVDAIGTGTVGQTVARAGVLTASKVVAPALEATVFSIPEFISSDDNKFDIWAGNMAFIAANKAVGGLTKMATQPKKSAVQTIKDLSSMTKNDGYLSVRERVDDYITRHNGEPNYFLSKDELQELQTKGYGDLGLLFSGEDKYFARYENATSMDDAARQLREKGEYSLLAKAIGDEQLSQAVRARLYFIATDRCLPVHTAVKTNIEDTGRGYAVQTYDKDGVVITCKYFKDRAKAAQYKATNADRQIELNAMYMADYNMTQKALLDANEEVINELAQKYDQTTYAIRRILKDYAADPEAADDIAKKIHKEFVDTLPGSEEVFKNANANMQAVKDRIKEGFGVGVDEAMRKKASERNVAEQNAIDAYLDACEQANKSSDVYEKIKLNGSDNVLFAVLDDDKTVAIQRGEITVDKDGQVVAKPGKYRCYDFELDDYFDVDMERIVDAQMMPIESYKQRSEQVQREAKQGETNEESVEPTTAERAERAEEEIESDDVQANEVWTLPVNGRRAEAVVVDREGDKITVWTSEAITEGSEKPRTFGRGYVTELTADEFVKLGARPKEEFAEERGTSEEGRENPVEEPVQAQTESTEPRDVEQPTAEQPKEVEQPTAEVAPTEETDPDAMPMREVKYSDGEVGREPDFTQVTPERAVRYLDEESGMESTDVDKFVANMIAKSAKAVEEHSQKRPEMGEDEMPGRFSQRLNEWKRQGEELQTQKAYWDAVNAERERVKSEEVAEAESPTIEAETAEPTVTALKVDESPVPEASEPMTESQRKAAENIATKLGYTIEWHDTMPENGRIDYATRTIHLAKDAENPLVVVFGHETYHELSKDEQTRSDVMSFVKDVLGEEEFNRRLQHKQDVYRDTEYGNNLNEMEDEVACDVFGKAIYDNGLLERISWEADHKILGAMLRVLDKILSSVGLKDAKLTNAYLIISSAYNRGLKRAEMSKLTTKEEVAKYSLKQKDKVDNGSKEYYESNKQKANISEEVFNKAQQSMDEMAKVMEESESEAIARGNKMLLPDEILKPNGGGSTIVANGSYGKTMENTLYCLRTLAYNQFVGDVAKQIGRPLSQKESFLASQMVYEIATDAQCLYCYVSLDRKAYDDFLIRYVEQRDNLLDKFNKLPNAIRKECAKKGAKPHLVLKDLYDEFLNKRKDTKPMQARFDMWIRNEVDGTPVLRLKDLATKDIRESILNGLDDSLKMQMVDATKYAESASWAKKEVDYVSYTGELLKLNDKWIKRLTNEYGLRFYSFSEYTAAFLLENMQMVRDAALRGLNGLAYTKEIDFVKVFAPTGMNINVSCYGRRDENGNMVMDTRQGANWEEVKRLRQQYDNVGAVFVATNDKDVEWALDQDWIDVIIPFHIVRTGADIAEFYGWKNYSAVQKDQALKGSKSMYISPVEHQNDREKFLEACEKYNVKPRFSEWLWHPNYMRLVNETRQSTINTKPMQPIFDIEAAKDSWKRFAEKGGYYGGWWKVDPETYAKAVERVVKDVKGDAVIENGFVDEKGAAAIDRAEDSTTRIDKLGVARQMESKGTDAESIKKATGWSKDESGNWMYEVDKETDVVNVGKKANEVEYGRQDYPINVNIEKWHEAARKNRVHGKSPDVFDRQGNAIINEETNADSGVHYSLREGNRQPGEVATPAFKNNRGTKIARGGKVGGVTYEVGKVMAGTIYFHKDYANQVLPEGLLEKAEQYLPEGFEYNTLAWDPKQPNVLRFDECKGFDTDPNPVVGRQFKVNVDTGQPLYKTPDGTRFESQIFHDKWQWVGNDYEGFDVQESYNWSKLYNSRIDSTPSGRVEKWQEQLRKAGLSEQGEKAKMQLYRDTAENVAKSVGEEVTVVEDIEDITDDNPTLQLKKRGAKGWFDPETGKVVVNLSAHRDAADVVETVLHETIGHKGIEEMMGKERFERMIDEVWSHAADDVRRAVSGLMQSNRNWDYRKATREYLAGLAEKVDQQGYDNLSRSEQSLWQKVKSKIEDFLNRILSEMNIPAHVRLSEKDLSYMMWKVYDTKRREAQGETVIDKAQGEVRDRDWSKNGRVKVVSDEQVTDVSADMSLTESLREAAKQDYGSAGTSINANKLPTGFGLISKRGGWQPGTTNLDMGGGRFDNATEMLAEQGVTNLVFDRFNRSAEHNRKVAQDVYSDKVDTTTCNNVLNVINTKGARSNVILQCAKALKPGGVSYFTVYEGNGSGRGAVSKNDCWQENRKTEDYVSEIEQHYRDVKRVGKLIIASDPIVDGKVSVWMYDATGESSLEFRDANEQAQTVQTADDIFDGEIIGMLKKQGEDVRTLNTAIEAMADSTAKISKILGKQKTYDKETVKNVSMAIRRMLAADVFSTPSKSDINSMLGAVQHSIDKDNITESVDRLTDMFIDNQQRLADRTFEKICSTKGSKINKNGVESIARLDHRGQVLLNEFNTAKVLTESDIMSRRDELQDKVDFGTEEQRAEAEIKLLGLDIAERYKNEMTDLNSSIALITNDIDELKKTYSRSFTKEQKNEYREQKKCLYELLREAKLGRLEATRRVSEDLYSTLNGSFSEAKEFRERQAKRKDEVQHDANSDLIGVSTSEVGKGRTVSKFLTNNSLARVFLAPLGTFEQMCRMFGSRYIDGEGKLFNRFVKGWQKCSDLEQIENEKAEDELNETAALLLDKDKARFSDLYDISKKVACKLSWMDGKEEREFTITQGNLMYIYAVNKMPDGKVKLKKMGLPSAKIDEVVEKSLDPRLRKLADWAQSEFLPKLRDKYSAVNEQMFGSPMEDIENYFPIRILENSLVKEDELKDTGSNALPKTITGSVIKRTYNTKPIDILNSDGVSVLLSHVREMNNWASFAEYRQDLSTLLSYKTFSNKLKNMSTIYGAGNAMWKNFHDLAMVVAGAYEPKVGTADKNVVNLSKIAVGSCIAIRLNTALKQTLSYPAFAQDADLARMVYNVTPWRAAQSFKWAKENMPAFRKRWSSKQAGNEILKEWKQDWNWTQTEFMKAAQRIGMSPNAFIDALTVATGSEAVYQAKKKQYIKQGLSKQEAHDKAILDAEVTFNLSQQSSEAPYISMMQAERTYLTTMITMFRNSSMSYARQMVQSGREIANMIKYKESQLYNETQKLVEQGMDEESARKEAERKYYKNYARNVVKAVNFAYVLPTLWSLGCSGVYYLIFGDDKDKKKDLLEDSAKRGALGCMEGFTFGGTLPQVIYDLAQGNDVNFETNPNIALAMLSQTIDSMQSKSKEKAIVNFMNAIVSSTIGLNPMTVEDLAISAIDYFGVDEASGRDVALLAMRIANCPQSQMDMVYFDELGMTAREASKRTPRELCERYAQYKAMRAYFPIMRAIDEQRWGELKDPYRKQFNDEAKKLLETKSGKAVNEAYDKYESYYKEANKRITDIRNSDMTPDEKRRELKNVYTSGDLGVAHKFMSKLNSYLEKMTKSWLNAATPEEAAKNLNSYINYKAELVDLMNKASDNGLQNEPSKELREAAEKLEGTLQEWAKRNPKYVRG